jgi:hypothetical protein
MKRLLLFIFLFSYKTFSQLPETGVSGVYEVMVGVKNPQTMIK